MLIIKKQAEADLAESYRWYESKTPNLGVSFLSEIEKQFEKIQINPNAYTKIFSNVQRCLCKKFPFAIYFIQNTREISIIAVLHQRRDPAVWVKRSDN